MFKFFKFFKRHRKLYILDKPPDMGQLPGVNMKDVIPVSPLMIRENSYFIRKLWDDGFPIKQFNERFK